MCVNASAEKAPQEVIEAARSGLLFFLKRIPAGEFKDYGFGPDAPIDRARVGIPFHVYMITPSALFAFKQGDSVNSVISPTEMWYFPVMVGDETRAMLVVDKVGSSWQTVSLGMAPLAGEMGKVMKRWPRAQGYDPLLVVVFQASEYFFTVPQKDDRNLTALLPRAGAIESELKGQGKEYSSTTELPRMLEILKPLVQENLKQKASINR